MLKLSLELDGRPVKKDTPMFFSLGPFCSEGNLNLFFNSVIASVHVCGLLGTISRDALRRGNARHSCDESICK